MQKSNKYVGRCGVKWNENLDYKEINVLSECVERGNNFADVRDICVRLFSLNSLTARAMMSIIVDREKQTLPKGGDAKPLA